MDIPLWEVGTKRRLKGTSKVNTQTDKQTDRQTERRRDRRTFRIIESICPEGRCFEKRTHELTVWSKEQSISRFTFPSGWRACRKVKWMQNVNNNNICLLVPSSLLQNHSKNKFRQALIIRVVTSKGLHRDQGKDQAPVLAGGPWRGAAGWGGREGEERRGAGRGGAGRGGAGRGSGRAPGD